MSTVLISDMIDDNQITRDEHGWMATRSALLLNITGAASAITYNGIQDAILLANNYNFGQAHPTMTALYCSKVTAKAEDVDKVRINCEYRPFPQLFVASTTQAGLLTFGASVQSTQTTQDATGVNMTAPNAAGTDTISGLVAVDTPSVVLTFKRKEASAPSATVQAMQNTLNAYACTIAGVSYPALTLKLDRINADVSDNGNGTNAFMVTYEFSFKALVASGTYSGQSAFITQVIYQDSTGRIPVDAVPQFYWNYNKSDFSVLNLW